MKVDNEKRDIIDLALAKITAGNIGLMYFKNGTYEQATEVILNLIKHIRNEYETIS